MNQDVKALPVAWVDDLTKPQPHCVTDLRYRSAADAFAGKAYTPLVRQSDAESALAELQQWVDRLTADLRECASVLPGVRYMDPPDGGDVPIPAQLRRMVSELRAEVGMLYDALTISMSVGVRDKQRADTAEARLERARAALEAAGLALESGHIYEGSCPDEASGPATRDDRCAACRAMTDIAALLGEGK
jgi:hypothetical protein